MAVARQFLSEQHDRDGDYLLRHHRGVFYEWQTRHWSDVDDRTIRSRLYSWLEHAAYKKETTDGVKLVPFEPTRFKIANAVEAVAAIGHVDENLDVPAWLDDTATSPADVISVRNGLLHVPTRTLSPHRPALFNIHSLDFAYDPDAPSPSGWLRFLDQLWGDDRESIRTLGEVIGYILSGDTSQQKLILVVGPKRAGKGTILRVVKGLIGGHNFAAPTLSSLTTNFGLQPLIGKPVAAISDARLGTRADSLIAVERLLSISGEDQVTIDRKYQEAWSGQLGTRFVIVSNEIPNFTDASGALASRFLILNLTRSFYGNEDPGLTRALLEEAPGIFNWAMEGLDRLAERGYFEMPSSARAALRRLEDLSSPISAFIRDRCVVRAGQAVAKDDLYAAWKSWTEDEGHRRAGTKAVFSRDLYSAVPGLKPRRIDGVHVIEGIALASGDDGEAALAKQSKRSLQTPARIENEDTADPHNHAPLQGSAGLKPIVLPVEDEPEIERLRAIYEQFGPADGGGS